ncbi:MAG: hypothetical protein ACRBN8_38050 [Nannocystales bacterium]
MSKIEFNIRDLNTGEVVCAEFPDLATAETWLVDRPAFTQVLRLVTALEPKTEARLREAMRPLDDQERAVMLKAESAAEAERMAEVARLQEIQDNTPKDPDRPMTLQWALESGLSVSDANDDREITDAARKAVLAWIAERDTWVQDRGQRVAAASVSVWPGPIPGGKEAERIPPGGTFVTGSRTPDA